MLEKSFISINITFLLIKFINYISLKNNFIFIYINFIDLKNVINFFFNSTFFNMKLLLDIIVVDYPGQQKRFKIIYNLCSYYYNLRFFIVFPLKDLQKITTLTYIFGSANWAEREAWDMFGIKF